MKKVDVYETRRLSKRAVFGFDAQAYEKPR